MWDSTASYGVLLCHDSTCARYVYDESITLESRRPSDQNIVDTNMLGETSKRRFRALSFVL